MRRKRIPQSLIREAQKRIDRIRENMEERRAQEGKGRANDYLRAGMPLPAWVGKNWRYLEAMGWHQPHLSLPWNSSLMARC
jgi:hypothetical protein